METSKGETMTASAGLKTREQMMDDTLVPPLYIFDPKTGQLSGEPTADEDLKTLFAQICAGAGVCMGGIYEDVAVELAKIARAGEREACARVCEDVDATHGECQELARYCAAEIRLRSKS